MTLMYIFKLYWFYFNNISLCFYLYKKYLYDSIYPFKMTLLSKTYYTEKKPIHNFFEVHNG